MTRTTLALSLGLVVLTVGCPKPETACTDDARSSITLSVVDEMGVSINDATATYSVDGSAAQDCEGWSDGSFACGWEQAGTFEITVDAAGYDAQTITQDVAEDECHVITELIEVTLMPVACTGEEVPSVEVTVTDVQGMDVTSGDVMWNMAAEDDLPEPCHHQGGNVWTCAAEVAGELVIEIDNAGPYQPFAEYVTVTADECHVITEQLDAVLEYLPD